MIANTSPMKEQTKNGCSKQIISQNRFTTSKKEIRPNMGQIRLGGEIITIEKRSACCTTLTKKNGQSLPTFQRILKIKYFHIYKNTERTNYFAFTLGEFIF